MTIVIVNKIIFDTSLSYRDLCTFLFWDVKKEFSRLLNYEIDYSLNVIVYLFQVILYLLKNPFKRTVYLFYFQKKKVSYVFCAIADHNDTVSSFLEKISTIEEIVKQKNEKEEKEGVALSSIHASKGLEFETVYLADIYDKVCPRTLSGEDNVLYEEERRILYVAMTRAKNKLVFINAMDKNSEFIDEIFNGKRKPRVFRVTR